MPPCLYSIGYEVNTYHCDKNIVTFHNSQSLDIVGLDFLVISNPSRAKTTPVVMISFCPLSAITDYPFAEIIARFLCRFIFFDFFQFPGIVFFIPY